MDNDERVGKAGRYYIRKEKPRETRADGSSGSSGFVRALALVAFGSRQLGRAKSGVNLQDSRECCSLLLYDPVHPLKPVPLPQ